MSEVLAAPERVEVCFAYLSGEKRIARFSGFNIMSIKDAFKAVKSMLHIYSRTANYALTIDNVALNPKRSIGFYKDALEEHCNTIIVKSKKSYVEILEEIKQNLDCFEMARLREDLTDAVVEKKTKQAKDKQTDELLHLGSYKFAEPLLTCEEDE